MESIALTEVLHIPYEAAGLTPPASPARLTPVCLPHSNEISGALRPAVVICPGGGYDYCSDREAEPVAMRFASYGVQAFVLRYTCQQPFPLAMLELAAAVRYVREHAADNHIAPNRIAICGFSAGAHLAASLAVHHHHNVLTDVLGDPSAYRPNGQILCYPVITAGEAAHRSSIENLLRGGAYREEMLSLEKHVDAETPPCFLWHTSDDGCVPVENSLYYLTALAAAGIPFESHIYPHGTHGLSLADETTSAWEGHLNPVCAGWFADCIAWIRRGYQ